MRLRVARAGHDDAVGKDLDADFAAGVLVIAVCDRVDEGLAERVLRVFRQTYLPEDCRLRRPLCNVQPRIASSRPGLLLLCGDVTGLEQADRAVI